MRCVQFIITITLLGGCSESDEHHTARQLATCGSAIGGDMNRVRRFRETAQPDISGQDVGIADIYDRELPDDSGQVRSRPSGVLVISDPTAKNARSETVREGSIVTIGADKYCVVSIEVGRGEPGWLSLAKL